MKSIRQYTFETNSSSAHSMVVPNIKKIEIDNFNEGKTWYCNVGRNYNKPFWTTAELVEELKKTIDTEEYKNMSCDRCIDEKFSPVANPFEGIWNTWNLTEDEEKTVIEDFENFKGYIAENLSEDMFEWAFGDSKEKKYFSKYLIRAFIRYWIEEVWYSPLLKIDDLSKENWANDISIQLNGGDYNYDKGSFKLKDGKLVPFDEKWEDGREYDFAINLRD